MCWSTLTDNKSRAAEYLGIARPCLYQKMKRLGIKQELEDPGGDLYETYCQRNRNGSLCSMWPKYRDGAGSAVIKLNYIEAMSIICDELLERAREGKDYDIMTLLELGSRIITEEDVMEGTPADAACNTAGSDVP